MLKLIFWIVVGLLALSFFGISLRALVQAPATQDNFSFMWQLVGNGWNTISLWFSQLASSFSLKH